MVNIKSIYQAVNTSHPCTLSASPRYQCSGGVRSQVQSNPDPNPLAMSACRNCIVVATKLSSVCLLG